MPNKEFDLKSVRRHKLLTPQRPQSTRTLPAEHVVSNAHAYPLPHTKKGYPYHRPRSQHTKRANLNEPSSVTAVTSDSSVKARVHPDVYLYTRDAPFDIDSVIDKQDQSQQEVSSFSHAENSLGTTSVPNRGPLYKSHAKYVHSHTKINPSTAKSRSLNRFDDAEFEGELTQLNDQDNDANLIEDYFNQLANISQLNNPVTDVTKLVNIMADAKINSASDKKNDSIYTNDPSNETITASQAKVNESQFGEVSLEFSPRLQYSTESHAKLSVVTPASVLNETSRDQPRNDTSNIEIPHLKHEVDFNVKVYAVTPVSLSTTKSQDEPLLEEDSLDVEESRQKNTPDFNIKASAITPVSISVSNNEQTKESEDIRKPHFKHLAYFQKMVAVTPENHNESQFNDDYSNAEDDSNNIEEPQQTNVPEFNIKVSAVTPNTDLKSKDPPHSVDESQYHGLPHLKHIADYQVKVSVVTPVSSSKNAFSPTKDGRRPELATESQEIVYYKDSIPIESSSKLPKDFKYSSKHNVKHGFQISGEYVSKLFSTTRPSSKKHQSHHKGFVKYGSPLHLDSVSKEKDHTSVTKDTPDVPDTRFVKYGLPLKGAVSNFLYKNFTTASYLGNVTLVLESSDSDSQENTDDFQRDIKMTKSQSENTKYSERPHFIKIHSPLQLSSTSVHTITSPFIKYDKSYTKVSYPHPTDNRLVKYGMPIPDSAILQRNSTKESSKSAKMEIDDSTNLNVSYSNDQRPIKVDLQLLVGALDNVVPKALFPKPATKVTVNPLTKYNSSLKVSQPKDQPDIKQHRLIKFGSPLYEGALTKALTSRTYTYSRTDKSISVDRNTPVDYFAVVYPDFKISRIKNISALPYTPVQFLGPKLATNNIKWYRLHYTPFKDPEAHLRQDASGTGGNNAVPNEAAEDAKQETFTNTSHLERLVQEFMSNIEDEAGRLERRTWQERQLLMLPERPFTNTTRSYPEHQFVNRLSGLIGIFLKPIWYANIILVLMILYIIYKIYKIEKKKKKYSNYHALKRQKPTKDYRSLVFSSVVFLFIMFLELCFHCTLIGNLPMISFDIDKENSIIEYHYLVELESHMIKFYSGNKHTANKAWESDSELKKFSFNLFYRLSEQYELCVDEIERTTDAIRSKDNLAEPHFVQSMFKQSCLFFGWLRYVISMAIWSGAVGVSAAWMWGYRATSVCGISGLIFCSIMGGVVLVQMVTIAEFCQEPNLVLVHLQDYKLYYKYLNSRMVYLCEMWHHAMRDTIKQYQRTAQAAIALVKKNKGIVKKQNAFENFMIDFEYAKSSAGAARVKYNEKWNKYFDKPILDLKPPFECDVKYKFSPDLEDAWPLCQDNLLTFWMLLQLLLLTIVALTWSCVVFKNISNMTDTSGYEKSKAMIINLLKSSRRESKKRRRKRDAGDEDSEECGAEPMPCPYFAQNEAQYAIVTAKTQVSRNIFRCRMKRRGMAINTAN